jgi:hypothetical protein
MGGWAAYVQDLALGLSHHDYEMLLMIERGRLENIAPDLPPVKRPRLIPIQVNLLATRRQGIPKSILLPEVRVFHILSLEFYGSSARFFRFRAQESESRAGQAGRFNLPSRCNSTSLQK